MRLEVAADGGADRVYAESGQTCPCCGEQVALDEMHELVFFRVVLIYPLPREPAVICTTRYVERLVVSRAQRDRLREVLR